MNSIDKLIALADVRGSLDLRCQMQGTLALMSDKRLGPIWQAMLEDPAHDWTIERLASAASMSRATFMRAFTKLSGSSPWVLLTRVHMDNRPGRQCRSGRCGSGSISCRPAPCDSVLLPKINTYLAPLYFHGASAPNRSHIFLVIR